MATVTLSPSASNHDAYEVSGGTVTLTDVYHAIVAGTQWGGYYVDATAYLSAFPGNVTSALFRYKPTATTHDSPIIDWYMQDADTAAVFTTGASDISSRTRTGSFVVDSASDVGTGFRDIDITSLFQTVTSRGGWTGPLVVIADGKASSSVRITAYDNGSNYWQIDVIYTAAGGQPTIVRGRNVPGMGRPHGHQGW